MPSILKLDPFHFVSLEKTPWGGSAISEIKKRYFPNDLELIPDRIGESWEVSTDPQFLSSVIIDSDSSLPLDELLLKSGKELLGENVHNRFRNSCPLLLKWLHANDLLSLQLHPTHSNPQLKDTECGKPESWLVLDVEKGGFIYLGFKEGYTQHEIEKLLLEDNAEECLYKYYPKPFDYIAVPPGCVHAIGPGVLLIEPQLVLPKKSGKTWRISDWKRKYDEKGNLSSNGKPRETHTAESLASIDWTLPRGEELKNRLIHQFNKESLTHKFIGIKDNPFSLELFHRPGFAEYIHLHPGQFSLLTVWSGSVTLTTAHETRLLHGGESAFISASETQPIGLELSFSHGEAPAAAFLSLNLEVI